jgi:hypothetical protein
MIQKEPAKMSRGDLSGKLIEAKSNHPVPTPSTMDKNIQNTHTHSRTSWAKGLRAFVDYVVLVSYLDGCQ